MKRRREQSGACEETCKRPPFPPGSREKKKKEETGKKKTKKKTTKREEKRQKADERGLKRKWGGTQPAEVLGDSDGVVEVQHRVPPVPWYQCTHPQYESQYHALP
eukprot:1438292-Rhodomonas_salina.1